MKTLFTTIALALLCLSFIKTKRFIPPGTVQISNTLFADETEVTNSGWQEYEFSIKKMFGANSKEHLATLPDTLCWRDKLSYNEPYVHYYYRHPAYKDFPIVGISYEQAVAFCKWRTEKVKTYLSIKKDYKNQSFDYRLPTKAEWEFFGESSDLFLDNDGKDAKGNARSNFICLQSNGDGMSPNGRYADVTAPVHSYKPNALKIYNAVGNVAEMISEKGICKGGGWRNMPEDCRIRKDMEYTKPASWIGFRCVCIVGQ